MMSDNERRFQSAREGIPDDQAIQNKTVWNKLQKIAEAEDATQPKQGDAPSKPGDGKEQKPLGPKQAAKDVKPGPKDGAKEGDGHGKEDNKPKSDEALVLLAIRTELKDLLDEDARLFMQKWEKREDIERQQFEEQRRKMDQIQKTLQETREEILDTVKAGPWQRVEDSVRFRYSFSPSLSSPTTSSVSQERQAFHDIRIH